MAVILTKGAKASNVVWTAGSAITLGTDSKMSGTMLAGTAVSLLSGASREGRRASWCGPHDRIGVQRDRTGPREQPAVHLRARAERDRLIRQDRAAKDGVRSEGG